MTLYAWTSSPLEKHLLNTWRVVYTNKKLLTIAKTLAKKIVTVCENKIDYREAFEAIALAHLLHDIGKAASIYQRHILEGNAKPSFKYHEIVSACLTELALTHFLALGNMYSEYLSAILVLSILNHHHAMRNIALLDAGQKNEVMELLSKIDIADELLSVIKNIVSKNNLSTEITSVIRDFMDYAIERAKEKECLKCFQEYIRIGDMAYTSWINELLGKRYIGSTLTYIVNALSGLISIADNIVASIERSGCFKGFSYSLAKELDINVNNIASMLY